MSSLRILLVDDQEPVRQHLRSLLSSRTNWLVCGEAMDGLEAVEKAKILRPNIVVMDISMPQMNGLDATRIIQRELPDSKVVIVSQNDPAVVCRQAREVDAAAYVAKSDLSQDLLPTLDRLIGHTHAEITSSLRTSEPSSPCQGLPDARFTTDAPVPNGAENVAESTVSQNGDPVDTSIPDGGVSLESILCTEELHRRPSRPPDHEKENRALVALAQALADSPRTVLQTLAETLLEVCCAGSAGVSLLTTEDDGKRFYWPAIAGSWKSHIGGGTPRDFGPCGDVLDRNSSLLFSHVERRYTYFQPVTPPVEECLLVPFYVEGKAVGTIWAIAHDDRRKFDAEDERLMTSLGIFASSAYQILASLDALKSQMAEREKAERASGLLAAIVDSSDDAIISKRLDGVITSWNTSAEGMFGYAAEEAIGQHITLIIPPDRRDEETTILERLRRGERIEHFETVRVRKDGTALDISLTISPVKDAAGRVVGASKVARDITERKRAERALRESEERLRTLADELENQVRARTEELQQRNREVVMQSEQLRELSQRLIQTQDEERRHIARELHDSAGQILTALGMNLAAVVQRARNSAPELAKIAEEGQQWVRTLSQEIRTTAYLLHPPLLDESGLSETLRWYIQGLKERSGLDITLVIPEDLGRLSREMELAIFRIVQECLTNVHRHSASKVATVRFVRTAQSVSVEIQDEGRGVSPERLVEIQSRGAGVGIRGMRERVLQFGGEMKIQSEGCGTKISITLPLVKAANSKTAERIQKAQTAGIGSSVREVGSAKSMRILIADDSEMVRRGIKELLSSETNLEVCGEAADGADALRQARELLPDLILLDISMPGQSGLEAAGLLRQELPKVKIIIMSQHDPTHLLPRALEAGAHACVDKSRLSTDLFATIESIGGTP